MKRSRTRARVTGTGRPRRVLAAAGVVAALGLGWLALGYLGAGPRAETVPLMPSRDHVPEDAYPGPYNTDPPTSGRHYDTTFGAGFYDEAVAGSFPPHPEGHLVHNLEHGYVIFWYNCDRLDETGCRQLKDHIRSLMTDYQGVKLIAFPWTSIDDPVVMTSWGHLLRLPKFDARRARAFIDSYRFKAPEPNAP